VSCSLRMRTCLADAMASCSVGVRRFGALSLLVVASMAAAVCVPAAASAATTGQVDLKVLLIGTSSTQADFTAWQAALTREGVPFTTILTSTAGRAPITAATLSDTLANGNPEGKYDGVIIASGDLLTCATTCTSGLASSEWDALETYEATFHVRQVDADASPANAPATAYDYGLNTAVTGADLDGQTGTLTSDGKSVFPYLNGPVLFGDYPASTAGTTTYGYEATPVSTSNFDTLLTGPGGSSLAGIYTDPNGVQELVETYAQNESLMQAELLQHGAVNWLTRGVYFGDQRNYVEMDIDDTFTPDDAWNATTSPGSIDYSDADALLMNPSDVGTSATWEANNNFRLDQLFNFGSTATYTGSPAVLAAFQATCTSNCGPGNAEAGKQYADSFGWISHTYDTPYLDVGCATTNYIEAELNENTSSIAAAHGGTAGTGGLGLTMDNTGTSPLGGTEDPHVFVPGNHSGFADLVPGTPATVDPPILDTATAGTDATSTLPAGTYEYAIADQFENGVPTSETTPNATGLSQADISDPVAVTAGQSVSLTWQSICHASDYVIYRGYEAPGATTYTWTPLAPAATQTVKTYGTVATPSSPTLPDSSSGNPTSTTNITGGGELEQTYVDTGAATAEAGGLTTPPTEENALESAWEQNPYFIPALEAVGITAVGDDASKPYPTTPNATFTYGTNETVTGTGSSTVCAPVACTPAGATFVDGTSQVVPRHPLNVFYNTSTDYEELNEYQTIYGSTSTWADVIDQNVSGMFGFMMANDPRPSYVHQTNIIGSPPAGSMDADGLPPSTYTPQPGGGPDEPAGTGNPTTTGDGTLYQVLDPLIYEYNEYFNSNAPYQQLTEQQIANVLAEQSNWAGSTAVTGDIATGSDSVSVKNTGAAIETPLTGIPSVGSLYGGIQSGWTSVPAGTTGFVASTTWPVYGTTSPVILPPATGTTPPPTGTTTTNTPAKTKTTLLVGPSIDTLGGKHPQGHLSLMTATKAPIASAQVTIVDGKHTTTVKTGNKGSASFTLAVGPSRKVTFSYSGTSSQASASVTASVVDLAYGTVHLTTSHLPASGRAAFAGKVVGANGKPAKLAVKLQYLTSHNKWRTVTTAHSSSAGKWKASVSWPRTGHAGSKKVYYRVVVAGTASAQITTHLP
jgi:hypothetical protein